MLGIATPKLLKAYQLHRMRTTSMACCPLRDPQTQFTIHTLIHSSPNEE